MAAENPTLTEIEIGVVVPSLLYAPILIAEHRGFLAEEGLRVTFRSFGTTNGVTEALRDGVVPVTVGSPEGSILDAVKGGDLRLCAGFVNKPPLSMIAQRRYHSLADLRDARLGTSSLTEGTCHLMEQMMAAHDLHQPKDFQFVLAGAIRNAGKRSRRARSMRPSNWCRSTTSRRKQVFRTSATWTTTSRISLLRDSHAAGLGNAHKDALTGLLRAFRRGAAAMYEDPEGAAAVVAEAMRTNPDHVSRALKDLVRKKAIPADLAVAPAAFATTVAAMKHSGLIDANRPPPALTDCADFKFLTAAA